jgi:hypothetical protein
MKRSLAHVGIAAKKDIFTGRSAHSSAVNFRQILSRYYAVSRCCLDSFYEHPEFVKLTILVCQLKLPLPSKYSVVNHREPPGSTLMLE